MICPSPAGGGQSQFHTGYLIAMASSNFRIIVRNFSTTAQHFHVFQKRATFKSASMISTVFSSSLGCQILGDHASSGAEICFELGRQVHAGAVGVEIGMPVAHSRDFPQGETMGFPVSTTRAVRRLELTSASQENSLNLTSLTIDPLGLSQPSHQAGIPPGAFGIHVPPYNPAPLPEFYCGVAALGADGSIVLSSYMRPPPNSTIACSPEQIFFVKTGLNPAGDRISYDEDNAARCDFTTGLTKITVNYNPDGTFSTSTDP